jgi:NAD(P)-dependent dehydrogenase (short-subunit alcohol dehydrogenase family)
MGKPEIPNQDEIMSGDLKNVVVITGACGGMGRACAARFASQAQILAVDLDAQRVETLAAELRSAGHDVTGAMFDLGAADAAAQLARLTLRYGIPWRLIHTAGLSPSMGDPQRIMAVNLVASQRLADAFLDIAVPGFAAVMIASMAGHLVQPEDAIARLLSTPLDREFWTGAAPFCPSSELSYSFSKWGVIELCEREAARWGRKGARINSVSPGVIDTPMGRQEAAHQGTQMQMLTQICPAGRWGRAEDIANAVEYLCSEAASFVTGTDLRVDGGTTAAVRHAAD